MIAPELLSSIHAQFRRQMNADVSNSLHKHGVRYRISFGVPSMRLKEIANGFEHSVELAETLWNEDIRESKMLATLLYPQDQMDHATALRWISEIQYAEIADQICMNLLSKLPFANQLALECLVVGASTMQTYCGLQLANRISADVLSSLEKETIVERATAIVDDATQSMQLRTAAYWTIENLQEL